MQQKHSFVLAAGNQPINQDSILAQAAGLRHLTGLTPRLEYYLFRAPVR